MFQPTQSVEIVFKVGTPSSQSANRQSTRLSVRQAFSLLVCHLPVYNYVSLPVCHYLMLLAQIYLTTSESPTSAFRLKFSVMLTSYSCLC